MGEVGVTLARLMAGERRGMQDHIRIGLAHEGDELLGSLQVADEPLVGEAGWPG